MKVGLIVLGMVLLLMGGVWTLQGLNFIKGSFMTGQDLWFYVGIACMVAGSLTLYASSRVRKQG